MLDRLEDIRKRSIRYAPSFQQDPFDIFARERVPLNRVRSPCVERPGATPHARRECVQWSSGEQFVPELGQYGLQHVLVIYHTLYLRIYGHTTSQSNIPYHLDGSKGRKRGSPLPGGSFLRQRRGESDPACHPRLERGVCAVSRGRHEEQTRHSRPSREVERSTARRSRAGCRSYFYSGPVPPAGMSNLEVPGLKMAIDGHEVLKYVSFGLQGGELAAILGPSVGVKTTLFRRILGELTRQAGQILI